MIEKIYYEFTKERLHISYSYFYLLPYTYYHNETGPAYIEYESNTGNVVSLKWNINGKYHRKNKPAKFYFTNGNLAQKNYYLHNSCHREDGPAIIEYDAEGIYKMHFYINGARYEYKYYIQRAEYLAHLKKDCIHIFD